MKFKPSIEEIHLVLRMTSDKGMIRSQARGAGSF